MIDPLSFEAESVPKLHDKRAVEAFSRWRSTILEDTDIAQAITKANRGASLTERERLQVRMVFDELLALVTVGPSDIEDRESGETNV